MNLKEVLGESYKEGMTFDEVAAALEGMDLVDRTTATQGMIDKGLFDRKVSELNKKLKEKMTADEQAQLEREAADKAKNEELEALRKYRAVNEHLTRYLKLGYDEKLAQDTAEAMVAQDFDKVFANQQAFLAAHDKAVQKQLTLANDKRPPAGDANVGQDYTKLAAEAGARQDFSAQAYYLRLAQQNNE